MKLVTSTDEVFSALQQAKRDAPRFATNLLPDPRKLETWIARQELFEAARGRVALLLRRDVDFHRVLFAAGEPAALAEGLRSLAGPGVCVSDLIGRQKEVSELTACFETAGFARHKSLQRLVWLRPPAQSFAADPAVVHATGEDAPLILAALQSSFDRFAEQIPPLAELATAAEQRHVLVTRSGAALAGLLHFEPQGQSAEIRYWYVSGACRGQGLGSKLMKTFFHLCPKARCVVLWVVTTNENAITKYDHYGFKPDGLLDQVMIKPRPA